MCSELSLKFEVNMIAKLTILFICIDIRIKSIDYALSIIFYGQSSLTIVCMIYFTLQLRKKEIRAKLESYRLPAIVGGHTEVYETWKKTLSFWLSSGNNEVYMASPFLEQDYLKNILDIVCKRKTTAKIGKIFVRENCDKESKKKFHVMLEESITTYNAEEQKFLREEVLLKAPMTTGPNYFHAKFIGCINTENEKAEVLLTSANFTSNHFSRYRKGGQNYESISYHDMSAEDFKTRFIDPLTMLEEKA